MVLKIEPLQSRKHNRSAFSCGQDSLDNYLRKYASQDLKKRVSAVFVLVDDVEMTILAYYTLSSYTVEVTELDDTLTQRLPRYPRLPATLLGRLAVDQSQRGQGYGELMLIDALKRSLETTKQVASVAVIVEALDETAKNFYLRYGFQAFQQTAMKLYLPMKSIATLLKA
ncbi:GNAT family N-acetyltransferase [Spirulina sp. CS-785/01]|uniref:GNAT family N-acetyltransferase n=1 Tax=Spirulina sp. CS-785/01 TaxID=3021716 RepID=UPI00232DAAC9|nr:GNAT family N-acetyltransferase [Spirulina sp. CS-785/01]MDB9313265.1 GNAT family N-acetyltransferase [Spirulina sp. CS-785/01]